MVVSRDRAKEVWQIRRIIELEGGPAGRRGATCDVLNV